jgi:hypothetical protein
MMVRERARTIQELSSPQGGEVETMKLRFWYAVYGAKEECPSPATMLASLRPKVAGLVHDFEPDGEQWESGRFRLSGSEAPAILVRRHRAGSDEVRRRREMAEAALATMSDEPHRDVVLSHLRETRQLIYLVPCPAPGIGAAKKARMCEQLCGALARICDGLIQVYQEGIFNSRGESLLPCNPKHSLTTT